MIKLQQNTVLTIRPDGSLAAFTAEDLEARLIRSCLATGIRDLWIAEDVALAVEFTLRQRENSTYSENEINTMVVKVLQEIGLKEVAIDFSRQARIQTERVAAEPDEIAAVLGKYLDLSQDELTQICRQVFAAGQRLQLPALSPGLILELGKYYRSRETAEIPPVAGLQPFNSQESPWLLRPDEIMGSLSTEVAAFVEAGILGVSAPVSHLFPALKLECNLAKYADFLGLKLPLTELTLQPHISRLAKNLDQLIKVSRQILRGYCKKSNEVPVYLHFRDLLSFAAEYLGEERPGKGVEFLVGELLAESDYQIITRNIPAN